MPEEADLTQRDVAEAASQDGGWGFGPAGWTVAVPGAAATASADADPEAVALRLWSEGRKDEAIAFLQGRIAQEKAPAVDGADEPAHPETSEASQAAPGTALALIPSAPGTTIMAAGGPAAGDADDARYAGKLIHLAPEPRVGDARPFRVGAARAFMRPSLLVAAALVVVGSVGVGAAIWPEGEPASLETPAPVAAAGPAAPVAVAALVPPQPEDPIAPAAADKPLAQEGSGSAAELPPEAGPEIIELDEPDAESAPGAVEAPRFVANAPRPDYGDGARPAEMDETPPADMDDVPPAEMEEEAGEPVVTAKVEPVSPDVAPAAIRTARLPRPRPHLAALPVLRYPDAEPRNLAVVEIPPPGPEDEYLPRRPEIEREVYAGYPPEPDNFEPGYGYLPPALAERRAAAARYAAARRAAERRDEDDDERWDVDDEDRWEDEEDDDWDGPVILRGAPLYTIQGPVILPRAPGY